MSNVSLVNLEESLNKIVSSVRMISTINGIGIEFTSDGQPLMCLLELEDLYADVMAVIGSIIPKCDKDSHIQIRLTKANEKLPYGLVELIGLGQLILEDISSSFVEKYNPLIERNDDEFNLSFRLKCQPLPPKLPKQSYVPRDHSTILPWYAEIRKQLTTHFKSIENLEESAMAESQKEGLFLKKVNKLIQLNLDKEGYNAQNIANDMAYSRAQLYRRIKALTTMGPAKYMRYIRMLKAKELLESKDYTVSEVMSKVGIISNSHFTRIFYKQFGFNPSSLLQ